jgi:hypothetical protein
MTAIPTVGGAASTAWLTDHPKLPGARAGACCAGQRRQSWTGSRLAAGPAVEGRDLHDGTAQRSGRP